MSICSKCNKVGSQYFQNHEGRTYSYFKHTQKNVVSNCYIGRVQANLIKPKCIIYTSFTELDILELKKLHKKLLSVRNRTQADLIQRIINNG